MERPVPASAGESVAPFPVGSYVPIVRSFRLNALALATAMVFSAPSTAAGPQAADPLSPRMNLSALADGSSHDRFIVRFREGSRQLASSAARQQALDGVASAYGLKASHLRRLAEGSDLVQVSRKLPPQAAEALMRAFAARPDVEYVEPDALMQPFFTPNDTRYNEQWHYFEPTGGLTLPQAWDRSTGSGVVVAVLDTGITSHSDLAANLVAGYDFISDAAIAGDGNGRDSNPQDQGDWESPYPSSWHGTHVAGTIAAVTNNGKGVAGVAFGAKVQPVRVLGKGGGYTSDITDAIIWASGGSVTGVPANATPAEVINMSLGGSGACSSTYQNAINSAVGRGSVVVVAAGNSNANVANFTPASCSNVISVAANDRQGNRASYSNYGTLIDVTAPGGETATNSNGVLSTLNTGSTTPGSESYAFYQGTSMAAPHVAGVVALMQSVAVNTPATVESLLKSTARALPGSCSGGCGAGIVNALAAVQAAGGGTPPPPPPPPGDGVLSDGVPVAGLSGASRSTRDRTLQVPAGASNLSFAMSGGTGDADLYVRFGSQPTTSSYDCRPYLSGNNETCTMPAATAGTWHVMVRGYTSYSGVSLVGNYDVGGGSQPSFFENTANYNIRDRQTVESPISVSGRSGNAPSSLKVDLRIIHTYRGDLVVNLVAPDGSTYLLHNATGGSADNLIGTYTVNASSEVANGTWKLRVYDRANGDTGYIDSWSLQF